jgi:hypothetical protein
MMPLFIVIYSLGSPLMPDLSCFTLFLHCYLSLSSLFSCAVIRATVPKMNLDDFFEQKNHVARAVEQELEKVKQ